MNIALRKPRMSREDFFVWAEAQNERFEFDGFAPVAMTGGNNRHSLISLNVHAALRSYLSGKPCRPLGPDAGLRTIGDAVRYPDALVTCSKFDELAREVPGVVVVFEVLSPTSGHVDRIVKLLEYRAVASIRRYVIVEYASAAVTVPPPPALQTARRKAWRASPAARQGSQTAPAALHASRRSGCPAAVLRPSALRSGLRADRPPNLLIAH